MAPSISMLRTPSALIHSSQAIFDSGVSMHTAPSRRNCSRKNSLLATVLPISTGMPDPALAATIASATSTGKELSKRYSPDPPLSSR